MRLVDINTTYEQFLKLNEEDKFGYTFQVTYGKFEKRDYFSETPLEQRSFRTVKTLMSAAADNEFALVNEIFKIEDYSLDKVLKRPAYEFLKTLEFICEKIVAFAEMENTQLVPQVQGKDYSAQLEQVDFSVFDEEFIQTYSLANGDVTKFEEVRNTPYETCFVTLLYQQKTSDFEKLVMQASKVK